MNIHGNPFQSSEEIISTQGSKIYAPTCNRSLTVLKATGIFSFINNTSSLKKGESLMRKASSGFGI